MDRSDLLNEFNRFSDSTLEKLITIGDSIISPMDSELTSVDFASMVDQVFRSGGLADRYYPEWTDRSKSDFGRLLVEIFATFSDKDFFYINHYSRESFASTAEEYRSLYHKALDQGFKPDSNISSTGNVELIFSEGATEVVPRGAITLGIQDLPSMTYINEEFTLDESSIDKNVTVAFRHGKLQTEQTYFDGHSIVIDFDNVVSNSIELVIEGNTWSEASSFHDGDGSMQHFMVFYDETGRAEIIFAKSLLGARPVEGQLCEISFITGGGYAGDIEAGVLNRIIQNQSVRNLESFTQFEMTGGNDQASLETLRHIIIGKERTQNRVVIPKDVQDACRELSFVQDSYSEAVLFFSYVYILTTSGEPITESQKQLVKDKIEPLLLDGFRLTVSPPLFVPITMEITIYLLPNVNRSGAAIIAQQIVDEFLSPLGDNSFGDGVNRSLLQSKILNRLTGSQNVIFNKLYRTALLTPVADLDFVKQELVDVENSVITINLEGGS